MYLALMGVGAILNLIVYSIFVNVVPVEVFAAFGSRFVTPERLLITGAIAAGTLAGLGLNYLSSRRLLGR